MMNVFLAFTMFLCLQDAATPDTAAKRSEIRIKVTMLGLDSSIRLPEEIADPQAYTDDLRRQQGIRWSERFVLSTMENREAKFSTGSLQAVTNGAIVIPAGGFGDRSIARPVPGRPADNDARTRPDGARTSSGPVPGRSVPTVTMESTGTVVVLTPSIDPQGRLLVDANIESSHLDDARDAIDAEDLTPKWCIRKLVIKTTLYASPGKPALLRVAETDAHGILPDQTVLILMDAQIVP